MKFKQKNGISATIQIKIQTKKKINQQRYRQAVTRKLSNQFEGISATIQGNFNPIKVLVQKRLFK